MAYDEQWAQLQRTVDDLRDQMDFLNDQIGYWETKLDTTLAEWEAATAKLDNYLNEKKSKGE